MIIYELYELNLQFMMKFIVVNFDYRSYVTHESVEFQWNFFMKHTISDCIYSTIIFPQAL